MSRRPMPEVLGMKVPRFRVATLNVLASHRTRVGQALAKIFQPGPVRIRWAIAKWNLWGISIVGLQELQPDVAFVIQRRPHWTVMSGGRNDRLGGCSGIAFRDSTWMWIETSELAVQIADGRTLHMPAIQLQLRGTQLVVMVIAWHAPARGPISGGTDGDRDLVKEAVRLHALGSKFPVILLGDANETHAEKSFLKFTVAAKAGVDLILTRGLDADRPHIHAAFKGRISDHPMLSARLGFRPK